MLSGKVAATLGRVLELRGDPARDAPQRPLVIPIDQAGVPSYDELVLVVREQEARDDGEELRAFMQALTRGERRCAGPGGGRAAGRAGEPFAGTKAAAGVDQAHAAGGTAERQEQAVRLPGTGPVGAFGGWMYSHGLLETQSEHDQPAAVHERVPARTSAQAAGRSPQEESL